MSHGSAHIGKHIGNKKKENSEKIIKKAEETRKKNEELYGRDSEQSEFLEAPYISQKLNKKSEKEKENQSCKVGCVTMGGRNKTRRTNKKGKKSKKSKRRYRK